MFALLCCRWGNQLSGKMFVGKDFVLKHIRTKHGEKVEEYKQQVCAGLYPCAIATLTCIASTPAVKQSLLCTHDTTWQKQNSKMRTSLAYMCNAQLDFASYPDSATLQNAQSL